MIVLNYALVTHYWVYPVEYYFGILCLMIGAGFSILLFRFYRLKLIVFISSPLQGTSDVKTFMLKLNTFLYFELFILFIF